jgi:hypothetical protein
MGGAAVSLDGFIADDNEIILLIYPFGQGTRLFPHTGPDRHWNSSTRVSTPKGLTLQVYRPTGRPEYVTT